MKIPLNRLSATRLAQLVAQGEASPETVTRSFIDAIREREADLHAFVWFDADRAIAAARELHLVSRRGPLHGLPIAVKDIIDTADIPTGYGTPIYAGHQPKNDAASVALLKDAGAFVFGKTVTTELALFTPGPTRNPHHPDHTPGGSSSGSAVAVAARFAPLAIGTQTAGSVIRPAAFCGVAAYKPSPRLVPRVGAKALSDTLDEIGAFAGNVEDLALIASVLAVKPAWKELAAQGAANGVGGRAPAIAVVETSQRHMAAPSMLAALERAGHVLETRGARRVAATWPRVFDGLFDAQGTVQLFETARALAPEFAYRREQLSQRLIDLIEQGRATSTESYVAALQLGRACAAAIDSLFGAADIVLAPSAPGEAPPGITTTGDPIFNRPWQLIGAPVVNLPVPHSIGQGRLNLPLGISVIGRPGDDARLLAAAAWIESNWRDS